MSHGHSAPDLNSHNTARFFTENRHISWVLLVATLLWGVFAYIQMPKRKDPDIPRLYSAAVCVWPGASAERIEQFITRKIDEKVAENSRVRKIESISRSNVAIVVIGFDENIGNASGKEFDDLALRLNTIRDLPAGAGPIEFYKDFNDVAALLLTVASPKIDGVELSLRARAIRTEIERVRADAPGSPRATLITSFPGSIEPRVVRRQRDVIVRYLQAQHFGSDQRPIDGAGFVGIDLATTDDDATVLGFLRHALEEQLVPSEFHPDISQPTIIRDPKDTEARLALVAGDKYSYRELDQFTELIRRVVQTVPQVSRVERAGLLPEQIVLEYSQERIGASGLQVSKIGEALAARNVTFPGGLIEAQGKSLSIDPSGEFKSEKDIGEVIVGVSENNRPLYLRDGVEIVRVYQTPSYLGYTNWKDAAQKWHRSRAITLALQMRTGEQIIDFGVAVDAALDGLRHQLPADLILTRPSDQPLQVKENVDLFMNSLYEAIVLVVLVALIGFWEWRSALLMAIAIPLTLAMTFGMMHVLKIDLQQVSIASLIIALGLLVDDPVVAGDAIKRELQHGRPNIVAAWLGPTKLATAILFATITNIVAYLPMLMLTGGVGDFIYSLPIVLACSLVASRITSMTFVPLLGYYLLRPSTKPEPSIEERRTRGFTGAYHTVAGWALDHRWIALALAFLLLVAGGVVVGTSLRDQFFPKDLSYLSYIDVWLPEDSTVTATNAAAETAERIIRDVAAKYGEAHPDKEGKPADVLASMTTFVGGGGPRFWLSVAPELRQPNYAQIILNVNDKHDTGRLVAPLQHALSAGVPGARVDVRQLETGKPVGIPVSIRLSGESVTVLRGLAEQAKAILRTIPAADRVRDDWGADSFKVKLRVDPDRANIAGVSNMEVALSSAAGMNGIPVTTLREGDQQIPVVARLRLEERARISDIQNLYVYSLQSPQRVPLGQVSTVQYGMDTEKLRRRNQFRTITVATFPVPGTLSSEVAKEARPRLAAFAKTLPPGYKMEIGGEEEEQVKGFGELAVVMLVSILAIFVTLVFQFRNAVKPLIVFSAIPFGIVGALVSLVIMKTPFGFMAFLGIASLIGVIVSHVIVLFDFIEEMHAQGQPLREALLDAGIVRLRPVLITVGATVFGLIPLALHGGPLWESLCYTQIGGLTFATVVTLVLVPVLYAIFVLDLKIVTWQEIGPSEAAASQS
jgi:multidrug efflux pump subunit AcrB